MRPIPPSSSLSRELTPELARQPGHLLWRAHARALVQMAELLPPDVDVHAYAVLLVLADGEPRSQQALAEATDVSRTTLAHVAGDLSDRGLVERIRNPDDRRSYALTGTPSGSEAVGRWRPHVERLARAVAGPLTELEHDELRALLSAVAEPDLAPQVPQEIRRVVGFLLSRVRMRVHRSFAEALEPLGIEPRLFGALTALESLGPAPQSDLARALGVSGASVVQIADDLERIGLVERQRLPSDRRSQVLHLRDAAAGVQRRAAYLAQRTIQDRLHPLDDVQVARLCDLLVVLVTAE